MGANETPNKGFQLLFFFFCVFFNNQDVFSFQF